jgi:hypothetical protein
MYRIIGADGQQYGPVSAERVRQWIAEGRANAQTLALREGDSQWKAVSAFPEFFDLVGTSIGGSAVISGYVASPKTTNGMAIAGMSVGIASIILLCCCIFLSPVLSITGIILSGIALCQIRSNPSQQGKGMAVTGLITSIVALVLGIVVLHFIGSF